MLDPNWFYSTLAQSAAAIVGIVGGLLTARLLADFSSARKEAAQLERAYWIAMQRVIAFGWQPTLRAGLLELYADHVQSGDLGVYPPMLQEHALRVGLNPLDKPNGGLADPMREVAKFLRRTGDWANQLMPREIVVDEERKRVEQEVTKALFEEQHQLYQRIEAYPTIGAPERNMMVFYFLDQTNGLPDFWILYRGVQEDYKRFRDGLQGKPYFAALAILGALALFSIFLPLARLTAWSLREKLGLLALFALGIAAFGIYVLNLVGRMRELSSIGKTAESVIMWESRKVGEASTADRR